MISLRSKFNNVFTFKNLLSPVRSTPVAARLQVILLTQFLGEKKNNNDNSKVVCEKNFRV